MQALRHAGETGASPCGSGVEGLAALRRGETEARRGLVTLQLERDAGVLVLPPPHEWVVLGTLRLAQLHPPWGCRWSSVLSPAGNPQRWEVGPRSWLSPAPQRAAGWEPTSISPGPAPRPAALRVLPVPIPAASLRIPPWAAAWCWAGGQQLGGLERVLPLPSGSLPATGRGWARSPAGGTRRGMLVAPTAGLSPARALCFGPRGSVYVRNGVHPGSDVPRTLRCPLPVPRGECDIQPGRRIGAG